MPPYIPSSDANINLWMVNFAAVLTASPAAYGLTAPDAVAVSAASADFNAALELATAPTTRSKTTVQAKDDARAAALVLFRAYSQGIKINRGISNENKTAIGVTVADLTPTRVPPPTTAPTLSLVAATNLQHQLQFADSTTPTLKQKPAGTIGLELWAATGVAPPAGPIATNYKGLKTRADFVVDWDQPDVGKTAYYYGRWVNTRGEVGPWSGLASMTIAG